VPWRSGLKSEWRRNDLVAVPFLFWVGEPRVAPVAVPSCPGRVPAKPKSAGGDMMEGVSVAKRISPMLATDNMSETISSYQTVLGFAPTMKSPEYSIVERDGQTIHLQKAASQEVMKCMREHTEIYIEVSGIHALWGHVKPSRASIKSAIYLTGNMG
jgi:hypothetical protein